jgi:predicted aconitase with swiveling domain
MEIKSVSAVMPVKMVIDGVAEGELVVSRQPFSFFGGFDFHSGRVVDPKSDIYGMSLSGKVFAFPRGKGSSSSAGVLLEALRQDTAPAAVVNMESEKILAVGAIVAQVMYERSVPILSIDADDFERLKSGDYAVINGDGLSVKSAAERGNDKETAK